MAQYIDKDALVTKLEERINDIKISQIAGLIKKRIAEKKINIFKDIISLINTLEVKDMNFNKELNHNDYENFFKEHPECDTFDWGFDECWTCAKYFFELGLNAQQNINIDITNIDKVIEENGVDPNSKEAKIFKESYYIALEKLKARKGE